MIYQEKSPQAAGQLRQAGASAFAEKNYVFCRTERFPVSPAGKRRLERRMSGHSHKSARAFTLIEMLVVIGILVLLLAMAGVGANAWINSSKARATQATMGVLRDAISEFVSLSPMTNKGNPRNGQAYEDFPYGAYFANFPPSPVVRLDVLPGQPLLNEDDQAEARIASKQFSYMVRAYMQGPISQAVGRQWLLPTGALPSEPPDPTTDHASIECLVLFLRQFCPRAKDIIDKLPGEAGRMNRDKDRAVLEGTNVFLELVEIADAWGQPLRYAVLPPNPNLMAKPPFRWELRSAGKDGSFDPAFSDKSNSDDVVLVGP